MKLISGGQTGVDQAALDVALELNIPCGGWCPQGRRSEDGPIAAKYPLNETPLGDYCQRIEWNVRDSDGTLILTIGAPTGGTALTVEFAQHYRRPYLVIDLAASPGASTAREWIQQHKIQTLNVAGPRGSKHSEVYGMTVKFLHALLG